MKREIVVYSSTVVDPNPLDENRKYFSVLRLGKDDVVVHGKTKKEAYENAKKTIGDYYENKNREKCL